MGVICLIENFDNYNGLTTIDLSPLAQVKTIGDKFLSKCMNLKKIICSKNQKLLIEVRLQYINENVLLEVIE